MATIAKLMPRINKNTLSTIDIKKNQFVLGRQASCDYVFHEIRTSSNHAIIYYNPSNKTFTLQDNATNGTYLNGEKIGKGNKRPLKHNDTIQFIRNRLEYKFIVILSTKPKQKQNQTPNSNNNNNLNDNNNMSMLSLDPFETTPIKPSRKRKQEIAIKTEETPPKKKRKLNTNDNNNTTIINTSNNINNNDNNNSSNKKEEKTEEKKDIKISKMSNPKRMRAADVRSLDISIKSGGLFSGVIALIIAKKSRRLDIIMEKFIQNGGECYDEMDVCDNYDLIKDINTIIMNKTMPYIKLTKAIKDESIINKFHIVTLEWISSSIQHKKILNTRKYIPKCLKNNNSININQINKTECPAKGSMDSNDEESDDEDYEIKEEETCTKNKKNVIDNDLSDFEQENDDDASVTKSKEKKDEYIIEQIQDQLLIIKHIDWKASLNIASFDMDGTLITTQSGNRFPRNWKDFRLLYDYSFIMEKKLMQYYTKNYSFVVFSNQKISHLKHKKPANYHQKIIDLKQKIPAILKQITIAGSNKKVIPFCYIAALNDDIYRKPHCGMFEYFNQHINQCSMLDLKHIFYVGDAAGREKGWKNGRSGNGDFSSSDRAFAANCKLSFFTPEEFFLNSAKCEKYRLMNLENILKTAKNNKYPSELININNGEQEMILMVGYPGSGKTTIYRRFFYGHNYKHINCDTLGSMSKCQSECKKYLQQKYSVVIDNTNPSKIARKRFIQIAQNLNWKINVGCVWIECERALAHHLNVMRWRMNQQSIKKIPVFAYKKYDKEFNKPQCIEGFTQSIIKVPFVFDQSLCDESEFLLHT